MNDRGHVAPIRLEPEGALLTVVLDAPPENRIGRVIAAELRALCHDLREGGNYRALILTGRPTVFSHGTDSTLMDEANVGGGQVHAAHQALEAYRCASSLASLPFPVIAAIEGGAFDQGLELALSADIRVAGAGARFRMGQIAEGLIPWDGGSQRLPRIAGPAWATDLIMTGRTIDVEEAVAIGLVGRTVDAGNALDAARDLAATVLAGGPIAARYAKEAVMTGMDMVLDHGILLETDLTMVLQTTKDRDEGIRSFLERRDPEFTGE